MKWLAVAAMVAVAGCNRPALPDGESQSTPDAPPVHVSIDTLFRDFIDNQLAAESAWEGKRIRIYGVVASIQKVDNNNSTVEVRRPDKTVHDGVIYCLFDKSWNDALASMKVGWSLDESYGVVGTFTRAKVFAMKNCEIVGPEEKNSPAP